MLIMLQQEHYTIVKIILLGLPAPAAVKTQYLAHLIFNSVLQLIHGISSNLQKLLKYFNETATVSFFRIPSA